MLAEASGYSAAGNRGRPGYVTEVTRTGRWQSSRNEKGRVIFLGRLTPNVLPSQ